MVLFSYVRRMDWVVNGCVLVLAVFSLLTIASAKPQDLLQQSIAFGLGLMIMLIFSCIDWRPLVVRRSIIFAIYALGIALLIATYFFAPPIRGARSWLVVGPVQFQTAEFTKIALIILYSYYFAHRHAGIAEKKNIGIPLIYALIPIGLILLQPDMGTALIIGGLWVIYLLVSGIRWRHIVLGLTIAAILTVFGWSYLADYQRERVRGLFNPTYDPLGVNYSVIQSKIAIGSGGWLGKGWKQGTQVQLGFLPEPANDFVFSAIVEEWGFMGGALVLGAFLVLIIRVLMVGARAENNFAKLMCLGVSGVLLLHVALNVGSAVGLMPVVGVSFPFVSYGGSNLLTSFMALGILQSIAIRSLF